MIELTTSAVFLVASLYGTGQTASVMQTVQPDVKVEQATTEKSTSKISLKTDSKVQVTASDTSQMEAYLREEFGADDAVLVDIARCESNFHQFDKDGNIIRGVVNQGDIGVMQINEKYHTEMAKKLGLDLYTTEGNVAYAKHLYEEQGTAPWKSSQKCWANGDLARK